MVVGHSCVLSWWRAVKRAAPPSWDRYWHEVRRGLHAADMVVAPFRHDAGRAAARSGPASHSVIHNGRADRDSRSRRTSLSCCRRAVLGRGKDLAALERAARDCRGQSTSPATHSPEGSSADATMRHTRSLGRLDEPAMAAWLARRRCTHCRHSTSRSACRPSKRRCSPPGRRRHPQPARDLGGGRAVCSPGRLGRPGRRRSFAHRFTGACSKAMADRDPPGHNVSAAQGRALFQRLRQPDPRRGPPCPARRRAPSEPICVSFSSTTRSLSDWNHGNAHFLRSIVSRARRPGHDVRVLEPRDGLDLKNLREEHGDAPLERFPGRISASVPARSTTLAMLDLDAGSEGPDGVIVHESNEHETGPGESASTATPRQRPRHLPAAFS